MYILVIDDVLRDKGKKRNSGYLVLQDNRQIYESTNDDYSSIQTDGDYYIDSPDTSLCHLADNNRVKLLPFGSVAIEQYNLRVDEYLSKGGMLSELQKKSAALNLNPPFRPVWFFDFKENEPKGDIIEQLKQIEPFQTSFQKSAVITLCGKSYTMLSVEDMEELFNFDLKMMQDSGTSAEVCKYCGHAFIKSTTDVMCKNCRETGLSDKEKQDTFMSNETNRAYRKLSGRIRKRCTTVSAYYEWLTALRRENKITPEWVEKWMKTDTDYQKLCKFFSDNGNSDVPSNLYDQWSSECEKFPNKLTDPAKWVEEWINKIK